MDYDNKYCRDCDHIEKNVKDWQTPEFGMCKVCGSGNVLYYWFHNKFAGIERINKLD